jgi:hypothetical protein
MAKLFAKICFSRVWSRVALSNVADVGRGACQCVSSATGSCQFSTGRFASILSARCWLSRSISAWPVSRKCSALNISLMSAFGCLVCMLVIITCEYEPRWILWLIVVCLKKRNALEFAALFIKINLGG